MDLSIVIVNYNVEHFLEQCILSVREACKGIDAEVFVVDNASVDGSCAMLREKFPEVILIANRDNVGFSKANNQAIRVAKGRYVLLLNPDTVVEEDTFRKVVDFMNQHPKAGGLGVRMVDGKGRFLPESKRGLPSPWVALCKISGIYRVFKKSRRFNHYYMGYLDEHETNQVEILSGAFMLMRMEALDKVGLLDEAFFMYGEDIDLSWRIIRGGYDNYYFPETTIIHYKGESTKKGSLNYVFVFYKAMVIFAEKHFSEKNAKLFTTLINSAIYARAAIAVMERFVRKAWLPLMDAAFLFGGLWVLQDYYAEWQDKVFDAALLIRAFSAYTLVWLLALLFAGAYDRPPSWGRTVKGIAAGSLLILMAYSLLPEDLRFSRALVLLGSAWALVYVLLSRLVGSFVAPEQFPKPGTSVHRFAIAGSLQEYERISELLQQTTSASSKLIHLETGTEDSPLSAERLQEVVRVHKIDTVIFSSLDLQAATIIELMGAAAKLGVDFKIAPPEALYMIGSNSIDTSGDLFVLETNSVHKPSNRRKKRSFDIATSLLLIVFFPLLCWPVKSKGGMLANAFRVLFGRRTWVGYASSGKPDGALPNLRKGILTPEIGGKQDSQEVDEETRQRLNLIYARDYRLRTDLSLMWHKLKWLGETD